MGLSRIDCMQDKLPISPAPLFLCTQRKQGMIIYTPSSLLTTGLKTWLPLTAPRRGRDLGVQKTFLRGLGEKGQPLGNVEPLSLL